MTRREINVFKQADLILGSLERGVLLTTKAGDKVNSMSISWGTLGIEWGKPIFTVFVRKGRFTAQQLAANPEFTVNIPVGDIDKNIISYCGSRTGCEIDKLADLGLTKVPCLTVDVPAVAELPLTLECKVIYSRLQDCALLPKKLHDSCYPQDIPGTNPGSNRDYHIAFCSEIVKAYIIEK